MNYIYLGTPKWRDIERWERICKKYDKKFALTIKKSRLGFEGSWYTLSVDIPNEEERKSFMKDIHRGWLPWDLRHHG